MSTFEYFTNFTSQPYIVVKLSPSLLTEPKVHLGKKVAFRFQDTAIADNLSPVI